MENIFAPLLINGIQVDVIYYLLLIPFVVMIATFIRHIAGLKIFSMFVFVSMTFVVAFLLRRYSLDSMVIGVGLLVFIYFFSYFIKGQINNFGLHYFSRISVVVTLISIVILLLLLVVGRFPDAVSALHLDRISPSALLLSVLLSEYFSSNQSQKGFKSSRKVFIYSIGLALLLGVIVSWDFFEQFMLTYPYVVFAFLLGTFWMGKYKGLRITEINRFRDIDIDEDGEE